MSLSGTRTVRGLGLPEVLIALFIISTGLLAFAWLMAGALHATQQRSAQDAATRLLADLHERLAVQLVDATTITAWQAAAAAQLPALPESAAHAELRLEFRPGAAVAGQAVLDWGMPGSTSSASAALPEVLPSWSAP